MNFLEASHQRRSAVLGTARPRPEAGTLECADPCGRSLHARTPDGELWFRLRYQEQVLYVEREETRRLGPQCVQSMTFRDIRQFEQWCDDDPARFEHPLLHVALKRDAGALWQLGEHKHV